MNKTAKILLIAISNGGLFPISAIRAQQSAQTQGQPGVTIEEVIVTGSNIPTSEEVGPNPVDVYNRDDLTRLGVRNATDLVQKLPEVMGASITENNVNGGNGRAELNLRGILPKETLVLQDGRRLAPVGFAGDTVDLNTIPIGLIDHVELLKDGASAIYGADAVAGVFNVYLIHHFRGLEIYSSYGNTNLGFANDQDEERSYLLAGAGNEKIDILIYAEAYNRGAIYARDADISHDADYRPFGGIDGRSANFAGRVGGFIYDPRLNNGAGSPTPHAFPNVTSDPQYVPQNALPPEHRLFNFSDITGAMGSADREYLAGSLDDKICDRYLELFSDFKYMRGFWQGALAPSPFVPDPFTDDGGFSASFVTATNPLGVTPSHPGGISSTGISVPIQNPFNPFTVADYTSAGGFDPKVPSSRFSAAPAGTQFITGVRYRGLEAGVRTDKVETNNYVVTAGLKGNLGEFGDYFSKWNWESAFRYNEDYRTEAFSGIVNTPNLRAALLDPNPETAFNPFGLNQNSRAIINRVFATTNHTGTSTLTLQDLRTYGDLFNLPAAPVAFAIGAEHRTETTRDTPDALTAAGETLGSINFNPTSGSRDVWSVYWELLVPVTSPIWNVPGFYTLELGYQERYENFSDFGSTERPKFSVRWQPFDSALTLRGTYTEAYHAPTLGDLFRGSSDFLAAVKDPRIPSIPPGQTEEVLARTSGNPTIQPETAYEWTYGAVASPGKWWSPLHGLTLSADFYHIDIRAVTLQLDPQFLVEHESQFPGQVVRGPAGADPVGPIILLLLPQQNLGRMIEEGWDYSAVYSFDTKTLGHGDWGTIIAMLRGTYVDRVVLQTVPGGKEQNVVGKFGGGFLGAQAGGSFTHNRWFTSLLYDGPPGSMLAGLDTGLTVHFAGQYWDNSKFTIKSRDRKVREWTTLDWVLSYTFNPPAASTSMDVAGYAKNSGTTASTEKKPATRNIAEYHPFGWRAWLNNTTLSFGINNLTDQQPPFVAASIENGYDESTANIRGRTWYVALRKRF